MASASIWAAQCAESDVSVPSTKTLGASGSETAVSPKRRMKYAKLGPKPFHGFTVSFGWVYGTGQVQRVQNRWLAQDWSEDTISPLYLFMFFSNWFFSIHITINLHQPSTCFVCCAWPMIRPFPALSPPWIRAWLTRVRDHVGICLMVSRNSSTARRAQKWSTKLIKAILAQRTSAQHQRAGGPRA